MLYTCALQGPHRIIVLGSVYILYVPRKMLGDTRKTPRIGYPLPRCMSSYSHRIYLKLARAKQVIVEKLQARARVAGAQLRTV